MKKTLPRLLLEAAAELPPQRPGSSKFMPMLPALVMLHTNGHTPGQIADFLVKQKEIPASERDSARNSIRNLLARHSPTA